VDFALGVVIGRNFSFTYNLDVLCGFTLLYWLRRPKLFFPTAAISISSFSISEFELGFIVHFRGMRIIALSDDARFFRFFSLFFVCKFFLDPADKFVFF